MSIPAFPSLSPKVPACLLESSSKESQRSDGGGQKRVIALHDFAAGSTDEPSFKVRDQVVVVSEALDGWWIGELGGNGVLNINGTSLRGKYYEPSIDNLNSASVRSASDDESDDDVGSLVRVQCVDDSFSSVYVTGLPTPQLPATISPVTASKTPSLAPTPAAHPVILLVVIAGIVV
ncbi:uncharacterized protein BXZ73DRAFT_103503 [Epithele typhae]|uniref:uncharacterized protein n=1 Tax=Epithele typhae TaxID=378194 RepID=UPI0020074E2B|nr:uncharacterized protein BXZ73DRAFT_103503 [Epithele typhae]KAH9924663.1 hypothetical protein BXZ73DRAFT_103503 [Epithele typhae]